MEFIQKIHIKRLLFTLVFLLVGAIGINNAATSMVYADDDMVFLQEGPFKGAPQLGGSELKAVTTPGIEAHSINITWKKGFRATMELYIHARTGTDTGQEIQRIDVGANHDWEGRDGEYVFSAAQPATAYWISLYDNTAFSSSGGTPGFSIKTSTEATDNPVVVAPPTQPAPIGNIGINSATNVNDPNSVELSWVAVSNAKNYTIVVTGPGGININQTSTTTQKKITGLAGATKYTVTVTAKDSTGKILAKGSKSVTTPSSLFSITARPSGAKSVDVRWLKYSGAAKYRVFSRAMSGNQVTQHAEITGTGYTITGLKPGTQYRISVATVNSAGKTAGMPVGVATITTEKEKCVSTNLSSAACKASAKACNDAGGAFYKKNCYTKKQFCNSIIGGTWYEKGTSVPGYGTRESSGCSNPNQKKVCEVIGRVYANGQCTGVIDTAACSALPNIGGIRAECAKYTKELNNEQKGICGDGGSFLNLPTWYKYLKVDPDDCSVQFCLLGNKNQIKNSQGNVVECTQSSVPLVILAIIEIALRIGAIIAVAFVVIGGIKFVMSQGEPDGVKNARNTIINALIGLVITLVATPIVSFIANRFGG